MSKHLRILFIALAALSSSTPAALGQTSPLAVSASANGVLFNPPPGGSIALAAGNVGQTVVSTVTVRYTGAASATITGISAAGTSAITVAALPGLPLTLNSNGTTSFSVQYLPANGSTVSSILSINFTENSRAASFSFTVTGNSADMAFSSVVLPNGALSGLASGDRIGFPATPLGSSTTATVQVTNRGSAAGLLQSVSVTGADFQVTGSPAPTTVPPGGQASFSIVFTPRATGTSSGSMTVGLSNGNFVALLSGNAGASDLFVSYRFQDNNVRTLFDGSNLIFPSVDVNASATASVDVVNQGTAAGTVTGLSVSGTGFQLNGVPQLPANISAGQTLRFGIVFTPPRAGNYTGSFRIDLNGRSLSGTLTASTSPPNLSLSYIDPDTNNILTLQNHSTLQIPNTLVGGATSITLLAGNTGAGTGSVNSISLGSSPSAFQLVNLPSLPAAVLPAQQLRFGIRFSPQAPQEFSGTLTVDLSGQLITLNLRALGAGPQFSYSSVIADVATPLTPGGTIAIADTALGRTSSLGITILNAGNGDGQISAVSLTGQGLALADLPALPFTVRPNGSQRFTLNYTPTQPGPINGRLTIGRDTFTIAGTAIGPKLSYTYTNAAAPIAVDDGGQVIFPPTAVGASVSLNFSIQNTGTSAAAISSINLASANPIFTLQQLPSLPFTLNAGASVSFGISFAPNNTGGLTTTLRVNGGSFTLSGSGLQPSALPAYQFQGPPSGNHPPAQQPTVGLTLASPYPLPLQGTLRLTFVPSVFSDDPSIQFASGGRTTSFTVPANSTRAVFAGNLTAIPLQTGTTAGTIIITPAFTLFGGFDVTPATPDLLTLTIQRSAPQLLTASVAAVTATSFSVVLNGYSTTRNVRQLDIQITPRPGNTFSSTHLTLDVSTPSSAWFQSSTSQGLGGGFLVTIPFLLNGSGKADPVHLLESLSITATNDVGASSAVSVVIP